MTSHEVYIPVPVWSGPCGAAAALQAKCGDRRRDLLQAQAQLEALEIELAEANAELDLRRSRMLRPDMGRRMAEGAASLKRQRGRSTVAAERPAGARAAAWRRGS